MSPAPLLSQRTRSLFAPAVAPVLAPTPNAIAAPTLPVIPVPPVQLPEPPTLSSIAPPADTSAPTDLDLLEQAIAEAEQMVPQAVPTAMLQVVAEAQAAQAAQAGTKSGSKETVVAAAPVSPDTVPDQGVSLLEGGQEATEAQAVVESGQSAQYVEYEPNPELPPEVEGYLNRVEQHADQAPKEVVIADLSQLMPTAHPLPAQAVVVLPITPDIEAVGAKKSPKFSIRWLVEWSHKIVKMFVGKVIYRTV